jgi:putative ABC transport system permease protein
LQDIKYGLRTLLKNPGFAIVAAMTLALGIGANSAIFSLINGIILQPLPYAEPERLIWLWEKQPQLERAPFTAADFLDYQSQNQTFEEMSAYSNQGLTLTGIGDPERIPGIVASTNLFKLLRKDAAIGRTFSEEDGQAGAQRVAVLTHSFWQRRFGGSADVLGTSLMLNGISFTVIGVMPEDFKFLRNIDIFLNPRQVAPEMNPNQTQDARTQRGNHYLTVIGRLKDGVSIEQAQSDIDGIVSRLQQEHRSNHTAWLMPLHERIVGNFRPAMLMQLGAVGLVLLITCVNIANLLLARATARSREIAIRSALGAGRFRVARQLMIESLILALFGGALGLAVAYGGVKLLVAISPAGTPRLNEVSLDVWSLAFTLALTLLTGLAFGLIPAIQASKPNLIDTLKEGGRSGSMGARLSRIRSLLVVSEVALSLVLLAGAGLLIKSFIRLQDVAPGFDTRNLLAMTLGLSSEKYRETQSRINFFNQLLSRLESLPGIESANLAYDLPIDGTNTTSTFTVEGRDTPPGEEILMGYHPVSHNYFSSMGITLIKGRAPDLTDTENSARTIVINETAANRIFPGEEPIGRRIKFGRPDSTDPWIEIVGVVGDVKHNGLADVPRLESYVHYPQSPFPFLALSVRTASDNSSVVAAIRNEIRALDSDLAVFNVRTMDEVLSNSVDSRRLSMFLTAIFAALALVLAAVGIYGVMSYSVTQRTNEIGIRMALGAQSRDVLGLVLVQGMKLTVAGLVIGLAGALAATRMISSLLFEVTATDPITFAAVSIVLALVAFAACLIPARRAMKVDPMVALRYE